MKTTLLLLALSATAVFGQVTIPSDIRVQQRDISNSFYIMRSFGAVPAGGATGLMTVDGGTSLPQYYTTGTGLSVNMLTKEISVTGMEPTISPGTSAQYYRGDKTWATFPTNVSSFTNDANYVPNSTLSTILANYTQLSVFNAGLAGKFNSPSGTTTQYIRGDGSLATLPAPGSGTVTSVGITSTDLSVTGSPITTSGNIGLALANSGVTAGSYSNVTVDAKGRVTTGTNRVFNNAAVRGFVSVAAASNGFQISTTRDTFVSYSLTIGTQITLAGSSAGYCVLEVAATNSATASDWKEISRVTSGSSGGVVVGVSIQTTGGSPVAGIVPANWYARLRTVSSAGTPTFAYNSGQEVNY